MSHLLGQFFVEKQNFTKVLFDTVCTAGAAVQLKPAKPEDRPYIHTYRKHYGIMIYKEIRWKNSFLF